MELDSLAVCLITIEHQAVNAAVIAKVDEENFVGVLFGFAAVPHAFRIDDNGRAHFARIQTARLVDPDAVEAKLLHSPLHVVA